MLKKENRLSKIKQSGGRGYTFPLFNARVFQNKENKARVGFVIAKKIDKRAVIRNRTKRVLSRAVKGLLNEFLGKDVVMYASKSLFYKDSQQVIESLKVISKKE